jgi:hypothetical protein
MRKTLSLILAAATLAGSLDAAVARPLPAAAAVKAEIASGEALRQDVQYYYRRHRGGDVALGVVGGLAAGALIAGAIASQQAHQPLHRTQDPAYIAYCSRKYRSFDPYTGTFLARDGYRYTCE